MSRTTDKIIEMEESGLLDDDGYDSHLILLGEKREEAEQYVQKVYDVIAFEAATNFPRFEDVLDIAQHNVDFHAAIWYASTEILPKLEVQVVIDSNNKCHVSTGSAGFVSFTTNPVGLKLPVRCWIHTHPFASAYFSGTDWATVNTWEPLMETAYVLGGAGHYGFWEQSKPYELEIVNQGVTQIQLQYRGEEE